MLVPGRRFGRIAAVRSPGETGAMPRRGRGVVEIGGGPWAGIGRGVVVRGGDPVRGPAGRFRSAGEVSAMLVSGRGFGRFAAPPAEVRLPGEVAANLSRRNVALGGRVLPTGVGEWGAR